MGAHQIYVLRPIRRSWAEITQEDMNVKGTVDSEILNMHIDKPFPTMNCVKIKNGIAAGCDLITSFKK